MSDTRGFGDFTTPSRTVPSAMNHPKPLQGCSEESVPDSKKGPASLH